MAKSRKTGRTNRSRQPSSLPIPRGFHTITPSLGVVGAVAALDFDKKAFGPRELERQIAPDGRLIHGRVKIGDSMVILADVFPGSDKSAPSTVETTTVSLHIYSKDVETLWNRADLWAHVGMTKEARQVAAKLEAASRGRYITPEGIASIHVALGDKTKALEGLERGHGEGSSYLVLDYQSRSFDSIRDVPRFLSILERIQISPEVKWARNPLTTS
jgi:uncharacterized glyoxalase superfamily protein PhnB